MVTYAMPAKMTNIVFGMNELDTILDSETGTAGQSFRTANGVCRIFEDRIELVRNTDETTNFLSSPSFIIRILLLVGISALLLYRQIQQGSLNIQYALVYLVPAIIILLSIMGNLNAFFYRIRSVLFMLLFLWFIYLEYERGNTIMSFIYVFFALFLSVNFLRSFDYSYVPVISRKDISQVRFINSIPLLTRAYFIVNFRNEHGKEQKRPILLPGILQKGETEKKHALQVMKDAKLIT